MSQELNLSDQDQFGATFFPDVWTPMQMGCNCLSFWLRKSRIKTRERGSLFSSNFKGENKRYHILLGGRFPLREINPGLFRAGYLLCFLSINLSIILDADSLSLISAFGWAWMYTQHTEPITLSITFLTDDRFLVFSFKKSIFSCMKKIQSSSKHFR